MKEGWDVNQAPPACKCSAIPIGYGGMVTNSAVYFAHVLILHASFYRRSSSYDNKMNINQKPKLWELEEKEIEKNSANQHWPGTPTLVFYSTGWWLPVLYKLPYLNNFKNRAN